MVVDKGQKQAVDKEQEQAVGMEQGQEQVVDKEQELALVQELVQAQEMVCRQLTETIDLVWVIQWLEKEQLLHHQVVQC